MNMSLLCKPPTSILRTCRYFSERSSVSPSDYCINLVKQYDYENFLSTLLLPGQTRRAAFSIRAFNIEVSLIGEKITEDHIGIMRYKWWDDAIGGIYSGNSIPKHPVVLELNKVIKDHKLLKRQFSRLLSARSNSIPKTGFKTMNAMEAYAEESTSPVYYLILQAAGVKDVNADHAASHLGKAQGLVNLIRSIPHHVVRRQCIMPEDILLKHDVPQEVFMSARTVTSKSMRDVIFDVASVARIHINKDWWRVCILSSPVRLNTMEGENEVSEEAIANIPKTVAETAQEIMAEIAMKASQIRETWNFEEVKDEPKELTLDELIKEYVRTMHIPPVTHWRELSDSDEEGRAVDRKEDEDQLKLKDKMGILEVDSTGNEKNAEEIGDEWDFLLKEKAAMAKPTGEKHNCCLLDVKSYGTLFLQPYVEMELRNVEQCTGCKPMGELGRCVCCGGTSIISPACKLRDEHVKQRLAKESRVALLIESGRLFSEADLLECQSSDRGLLHICESSISSHD